MVPSYYLFRYPYAAIWHALKAAGRLDPVVLYCANTLDWQLFQPVQKHLPPIPVVAQNKRAQAELAAMGVESKTLPIFPAGVIMMRQAAYRFPTPALRKVGMRHGPFVFKRFANPVGYNMLDRFLMTSSHEVDLAKQHGITVGRAVGFPKLDPALDGSIGEVELAPLRKQAGLDNDKPTVLFTATWDESGVSAVDRWCARLSELTSDFNVVVTVHPWTTEEYLRQIDAADGVFRIAGPDVVPWIMLADVCVGDSSSILAECCALDKPLITFQLADHPRLVPETMKLVDEMSEQISGFDELPAALQRSINEPANQASARQRVRGLMFESVDGSAGERAAREIRAVFPELR